MGSPRYRQNRRPSKDDGCCSVHFLKYILFIFNFLFYLTGLTILGVGLWTLFWRSEYVALLPSNWFTYIAYLLVGAGVMVLLVGLLGCCGVLRESRCSLLLFTFLLLVVFLAEAVGGVMAYIYSERVGPELRGTLNTTFIQRYGIDDDISLATQKLHIEHKCCGGATFQDWRASAWFRRVNTPEAIQERGEEEGRAEGRLLLVPKFCCISPTPNCGVRDHPSNIYYTGCAEALAEEIQRHEIIIGAVALGLSTIQLFGMVISCCLFVNLKEFADSKRHRSHYSANYY